MTDPTNVTLPPSTATLIVQPAVKPNPLKALVMSRKVWLAALAALVAGIGYAKGVITAEQFVNAIVGLAGAVILAIAYEDGQK